MLWGIATQDNWNSTHHWPETLGLKGVRSEGDVVDVGVIKIEFSNRGGNKKHSYELIAETSKGNLTKKLTAIRKRGVITHFNGNLIEFLYFSIIQCDSKELFFDINWSNPLEWCPSTIMTRAQTDSWDKTTSWDRWCWASLHRCQFTVAVVFNTNEHK